MYQKRILIYRTTSLLETGWGMLFCVYILLPNYALGSFIYLNQSNLMFQSLIGCCIWLFIIVLRKLENNEEKITVTLTDFVIFGILLFLLLRGIYDKTELGFLLKISVSGIVYLCFRNVPRKYLLYYIGVFVLTGIIQVIYSICNQYDDFLWYEKFSRIHGSFMNTSVWGFFLSIQCILLIGVRNRFIHKKVFSFCLLLFIFFFLSLLILSQSRTGMLVILLIGSIYILNKKNLLFIKNKWIVGILLTIAGGFVLNGINGDKKDSTNGRLLIWRISYEMIKDAPFLGHGTEGFYKKYMLYQGEFLKKNENKEYVQLVDDNRFAFNEYLKVLVEYGIVGGVLFLISLLIILFCSIDWKNLYGRLCFLCLLAYGISSFFSYPFFLWQFVFLFLFFVAGSNINNKKLQWHMSMKILCCLVITFCSFLILFFKPYNCKIKIWKDIIYSTANMKTKVNLLLELSPALDDTPDFLLDLGKRLNKINQIEKSESVLAKSYMLFPNYEAALYLGKVYGCDGKIQESELYLRIANNMIPHRVFPHFLLFCLYRDNGLTVAAKEEAEIIRQLSLKVYPAQMNTILREINGY